MPIDLTSAHISGVRTLEIDAGNEPVALFLDGNFYRERIGLPPELKALGLRAATLTGGTGADRHVDYTCSTSYLQFIVEDVLPRIDSEVEVLVGVSLGGLAVAHLAVERPELFPRIVAQSPSAWWNDEHLAHRLTTPPTSRAWFSVGTLETETDVRHPPTDMHQRTSQWDSVGRLAKAWGRNATLQHFEGGHETTGWAQELSRAITWVMSPLHPAATPG